MSHRAFSACACSSCKTILNSRSRSATTSRNGSTTNSPFQAGTKNGRANISQPKPLKKIANPDNSDKKELLCPICMIDILESKNPVCPPCGHVICEMCMTKLTSSCKEIFLCALCKGQFRKQQIQKIYFQ